MGIIVSAQKLSKRYADGKSKIKALDQLNLELKQGESLAVVGPSGSGKTTLLHMLGGLDKPDEGQVLIDGEDIAAMNDRELSAYRNRKIGFVFQFFYLQDYFTAAQNVMVPLMIQGISRAAAERQANEMLTEVGLGDRVDAYPKQLSGGQMQRVAVARALIGQPKLLLADEPTGNLDAANADKVMTLFDEIRSKGFSVITITHDPSLGKHFDHMAEIKAGQLRMIR